VIVPRILSARTTAALLAIKGLARQLTRMISRCLGLLLMAAPTTTFLMKKESVFLAKRQVFTIVYESRSIIVLEVGQVSQNVFNQIWKYSHVGLSKQIYLCFERCIFALM